MINFLIGIIGHCTDQRNLLQVRCNSRVSWDLAEKSQILLFAYPNVQRASIQLFMYRGNQFVNFKRLLKVQAIFYQRLSDEMKSLANASITHTTWTAKFVSNLVFSILFLSMKWLAQFHSPSLGRNFIMFLTILLIKRGLSTPNLIQT